MVIIKSKKLMLILILSITLLFSACSFNSSSDSNKDSFNIGFGNSNSNSYTSSTAGVVLEFDKNNPPEKMIKDQPVTFALIFNNYLKEDISNLEIRTKGFDRGFISGLDEDIVINKIPKMTSVGPGRYQQVISGVVGSGFNDNYNFNPVFEYAYTAQTLFIEQICIPNIKNKCDIKVDKSLSQNGPVTVKINRISNIDNNIRIDFSLVNSGNGKLVDPNDKFKTDNYVAPYTLNSVKLGSTQGQCKHIGVDNYQFMNGKSNFYCIFPRSSEDSYSSQITVDIGYTYNQEVSKKIIIEDLNQQY